MNEFFYLVLISFWVVGLAYVVVRAGSFAYFRTKLEYLRRVLHKINGG